MAPLSGRVLTFFSATVTASLTFLLCLFCSFACLLLCPAQHLGWGCKPNSLSCYTCTCCNQTARPSLAAAWSVPPCPFFSSSLLLLPCCCLEEAALEEAKEAAQLLAASLLLSWPPKPLLPCLKTSASALLLARTEASGSSSPTVCHVD